MDTRRDLKIFNAVAIATGQTKYSKVIERQPETEGHYSFSLKSTESVATSSIKVRLQFNNLSQAAYAKACGFVQTDTAAQRATKEESNTVGWYTHLAVSEVTLASADEDEIHVVSKPWFRCRLKAVADGGGSSAGTITSDAAVG
jgi:hypothetical protein